MSIKGIYPVWYWTCPICGADCDSEHETRADAEDTASTSTSPATPTTILEEA